MTREELHEQIWSQPIRTLAASIGISDVALAKRCKTASVPVPPRGWWARKEAGKPVKVEPLPPLPFVMSNYFPAIEKSKESVEGVKLQTLEPPVFRDLPQVQEEIRAAVKPIKGPPALTRAHPIVARLLKQDAARPPVSDRQFAHYGEQKFGSQIQQRRLRFLSCILTELERLGCIRPTVRLDHIKSHYYQSLLSSKPSGIFCHLAQSLISTLPSDDSEP